MKKFIVSWIAVLLSISAFAQSSLHLNYDVPNFKSGTVKVMYEGGLYKDNSITYALLSADISTTGSSDYFYMQLFQEFKFWEEPAFFHIEARSCNFELNQIYLGGAYCFYTPNGMIAIEPMYFNEVVMKPSPVWDWKDSRFQLSIVTGHDWEWVNLNSFTDIWTKNKNGGPAGIYSEAWVYFPVYKELELGGIVSVSYIGNHFGYTVFPGLKINF